MTDSRPANKTEISETETGKTEVSGRVASEQTKHDTATADGQPNEFQRLATQRDPSLIVEYVYFLRHNKKWWLAPILITTILLIGVAILAASPAAPFIYTLF